MPSGQDQRRYPRYALSERAAILLGPATYVFSETLDISRGGACLRHPNRFVVQAGEFLNLASAHIGSQRAARVVSVSARGLHCAFDAEPDPADSETSAAL